MDAAKQLDQFQPMLNAGKAYVAKGATFERPIMNYRRFGRCNLSQRIEVCCDVSVWPEAADVDIGSSWQLFDGHRTDRNAVTTAAR